MAHVSPTFPVDRVAAPQRAPSLRGLIGRIDALIEHLAREVRHVRAYVAAIPSGLGADQLRDALAQSRLENLELRERLAELERLIQSEVT